MRKLFIALLILAGPLILRPAAAGEIPNLEASLLYDFQTHQVIPGLTSKMISVKDLDLRVGYTSTNSGVLSVSYNLKNLEKLGPQVHYLWDSMSTSLGLWAGYNFSDRTWGYGISLVMIEVNF